MLLTHYGEHMRSSNVISSAKGDMSNVIRVRKSNPIFDTSVYDVMFPYGSLYQYVAKIIDENTYPQVDDEGYQYQLMDDIICYRTSLLLLG